MQYHCISLANNNFRVTVIATKCGTRRDLCCEELESNQNITQVLMNDSLDFKKYLPNALAYIIKPIWQALLLIFHLCAISLNHVIIVQNPPSIPTLPVLYFYSCITRSKLIVDWHNYGFTILKLNPALNNKFVDLSKAIEFTFGGLADAGFCVSKAMQKDLKNNHRIKYPLTVLYDRPPNHFKPLDLKDKHSFFLRIQSQIPEFRASLEDIPSPYEASTSTSETRFTMTDESDPHVILQKGDRPAILMSSTSWTEDEDFSLLLRALEIYDNHVVGEQSGEEPRGHRCLPPLLCVITGKGPLKSYYESKIRNIKFKHIQIVLPWLTAADYASMVGSCDLGVSLHKSSSGVDLPMKVVDLLGCGIPVLAYRYHAINELVTRERYGDTFTSCSDLSRKLELVLRDFYVKDKPDSTLARYRRNISADFCASRWDNNWNQQALPVVEQLTTVRT